MKQVKIIRNVFHYDMHTAIRRIIIVPVIAMIFMFYPHTVFADEDFTTGTYRGVPWRIEEDYTIILGEAGKTFSFDDREYSEGWGVDREGIFYFRIEGHINGMDSLAGMFSDFEHLYSVELSGLDTSSVKDMSGMFNGCSALVNLDLTSLDTSSVTDMSGMFSGCSALNSLDLSGFDTSNVTDMSDMFSECRALKSLDLTGLDTSSVTDMKGMFNGCNTLKGLDLTGFDTSNVTDMSYMFASGFFEEYFDSSLESLELSGFDTKNVESMAGMFRGCCKITELDVSGFDTCRVQDMHDMFAYCKSLEAVSFDGWDTGNVNNMKGMFSGCVSLENLDVSNFDTSNVTNMESMFGGQRYYDGYYEGDDSIEIIHQIGCSKLKTLDLSSFDTSNVTNMSCMFAGCSSLESIDLSSFNTENTLDISRMFFECSSLSYLDLSSFVLDNAYGRKAFIGALITKMETPNNVEGTIPLPCKMYTLRGKAYKNLPQGLGKSIKLYAAPKPTMITKLKKGKKGTVTVIYERQEGKTLGKRISGYQIQYSKSKSFKNSKTLTIPGYKKKSKTIKNLRPAKRYYFRIRTYTKVSKKSKRYSVWSESRNIKVR
ncbi:MAG: BspA family leucine-rich repeat surface protein [Mogibacterium sp.]|nr:BspA family leucine-rich repeat surface protein [Mogibacterium sp.]MBR0340846.1 BspA family leucine-rich repeat surface protein [Oscillospiraceae bacterium]